MPKLRNEETGPRKHPFINFRCTDEWLAELSKAAATMGQSVSDYCRSAINRQLKEDGYAPPDK